MNNAGFLSIESVRENQLANLSKQIDNLKEENDRLEDINEELMEERNRLNNIINELEKYINGRIEYCYNNGTYQDVFDVYNEIDIKLQELKGSDKE